MVGETLKELARNEEFQEEKEFYHENNLAKNSKIVRIYGIVKCLSVAAVVVGQLYLLKKYMSPDF